MAGEGRGVGVWLVGARGSVATTAIAGAAAIRAGLAPPLGCVTELPGFPRARLPAIADLVFGGHDLVDTPLAKRAELLAQEGALPQRLPELVAAELHAVDAEIRTGAPLPDDPRTQAEIAADLVRDLHAFRERHGLARVVVIHVASTEPPAPPWPEHASLARVEEALAAGRAVLPPSSLYAYAAFRAGCAYVDFTPSPGGRLPALLELAAVSGLPYAGSDAKTGETLVQGALAPMFASRGLKVRSWSGTNLLGGGDGATLADPQAARSKLASKRGGLARLLGYAPEGTVHIDYVPEMGGWKTAWDHISFEGFLGVRMAMQFTWQGCDSALAAPLVLDLARLVARAHAVGERGPLPATAFFFKDPVASTELRLVAQYEALLAWAAKLDGGAAR